MRTTRLFLLASGLTAAALAVGTTAQATGPTGSAFAISVRATLLDAVSAGVGPLPKAAYPEGADKSVVAVDVLRDQLAKARVLNASSQFADGTLTSSASIAEVSALGLIEAKLVAAECTSVGGVATGGSKLVDVKVGGTRVTADATAVITVGDLVSVRVNEQVRANGKLTVNALRVTVGGKVGGVARAEVILGQAVCSGAAGGDDLDGDDSGGDDSTTVPATTSASVPGDGTPTTTAAPSTSATTSALSTTEVPVVSTPVNPAAGEEDLAQTGVSAAVPLSIGGLVLLAGGGTALYLVRRRAQV